MPVEETIEAPEVEASVEAPAVEPEAAPEPEAPSFASPDAWEHREEWDGTEDLLPEEVRGWYGYFNTRFMSEQEKAQARYEAQVQELTDTSGMWKRMYDASLSGDEDPRVAELNSTLESERQAWEAEKAQWAEERKEWEAHLEAESERYMGWVKETYPELLDKVTPESQQVIFELMDNDLEFHHALLINELGPEAVKEALDMAKGGVDDVRILRYISKTYDPKAAAREEAKLKPPAKSADLVAGSAGRTEINPPATEVKEDLSKLSRRELQVRAARNAIARSKK